LFGAQHQFEISVGLVSDWSISSCSIQVISSLLPSGKWNHMGFYLHQQIIMTVVNNLDRDEAPQNVEHLNTYKSKF